MACRYLRLESGEPRLRTTALLSALIGYTKLGLRPVFLPALVGS
jgi:hypothetical protein